MSSKRSGERKRGLSRWERAGIPIIILILAWVIYSVAQPAVNQSQTTTTAVAVSGGSYAPDFKLPVVGSNGRTGESVALSSLRGKAVLLEFMEPWCPHCQSMVPVLERLHEGYPNVTVISVSGPWNGASEGDLARFQILYGSRWAYLYDSSGSIMNMYGVTVTPTFFIISKNGSVLASLQGDQTYGTLEQMILQSLR